MIETAPSPRGLRTVRRRLAGWAMGVAAVAAAGQALAWGGTGHRMIGELAVEALPQSVPEFLRTQQAAADVAELAREPDRWRGAGKVHDNMRDPAHFLDVDDQGRILGGPQLSDLPPTRTDYDAALRAAGTDSAKAGYLPYAIIDGWQQLAKDFAYWRADVAGEEREKDGKKRAWLIADRIRRERQTILDLGVWAHYVGDASQPLHLSVHYNGWGEGPNPKGYTTQRIHVSFEGPFVVANVTADAVRAKVKPPFECHCAIERRTAAYLGRTNATVIPFYELEKAGGFMGGDPRGADFAAERIVAGVDELRDMVVDAWNASATGTVGYPSTSVADIEAGKADAYAVLYGSD